jgi:hypothetical protein
MNHPTPKRETMITNTEAEVPKAIRSELADTIEDIGSAMGLLRESVNDAESGLVDSAKIAASDALDIISELEGKFAKIAQQLALWSEC